MTAAFDLGQFAARWAQPLNTKNMKFACDFSKWNGLVSYDKLITNNPKVDLVLVRASEGATNEDPMFVKNVVGSISKGIPFSPYHFATWNDSDEVKDATSEAHFFVAQLKKVPHPPYTVWLDTETNKTNIILSPQELVTYIQTFFAVLAANGYNDYGIYGSHGFIDSFYPDNHPFGHLPLWLSHFTSHPQPTLPKGWNSYKIWQFTDQGIVAGVKTRCDLNRIA